MAIHNEGDTLLVLCRVCRVENACCHQGIADVTRHINSKGHQEKQKALAIQQWNSALLSATSFFRGNDCSRNKGL